jgi:hypothetical protein
MERGDFLEPLRLTQSASPTRDSSFVSKSSPVRAPTLMLVNGFGEACSLPSPIVDTLSDDENSLSSETVTPVPEHVIHSKSLSVPNVLDPPTKSRTKNYYPMKTPSSPPKRSLSPPKMIIANTESKPRPVDTVRVFN